MGTLEFADLGIALKIESDRVQRFMGEFAALSLAFLATKEREFTPYLTGRARASTIVSAGTPRYSAPMPGRGPFAGQAQFGAAIRAVRGGSIGYVSQAARAKEGNSYSPRLDAGGSPKAERGMTQPALDAYRAAAPGIAKDAAAAVGLRL